MWTLCGACPCLGPKTAPEVLMMMMSKKKMQAAEELYVELSGRVEGPPQVPSAAKAAADQAVHAGCMARIASAASGITNTVGKHLPCYPQLQCCITWTSIPLLCPSQQGTTEGTRRAGTRTQVR